MKEKYISLMRQGSEAAMRCKMFVVDSANKDYYAVLAFELEYFADKLEQENIENKKEQIYKKALEEIVKTQGKVCEDFELCVHESCQSSCASWFIADKALKEAEGNNLYKE